MRQLRLDDVDDARELFVRNVTDCVEGDVAYESAVATRFRPEDCQLAFGHVATRLDGESGGEEVLVTVRSARAHPLFAGEDLYRPECCGAALGDCDTVLLGRGFERYPFPV